MLLRLAVLVLAVLAFAGTSAWAETTTAVQVGSSLTAKKQTKTKAAPAEPAKAKQHWEMPMKVVVVRHSDPTCEPNCAEWIMAEGQIVEATPALFRKVLKQIGSRKLPVIISSPGGQVEAAMAIGRMIRKATLPVAVGQTIYVGCGPYDKDCPLPKSQKGIYRGVALSFQSYCNSACPLILAAGVERSASPASAIGVHQFRQVKTRQLIRYRITYRIVNGKKKIISRDVISRTNQKSQEIFGIDERMHKVLAAYLKEMDVSPMLVDDMDRAPFSSLFELTPGRRVELRLITVSNDASAYSDSRLCRPELQVPVCVERKDFLPLPEAAPASGSDATKPTAAATLKALGIDPADKPMIVAVVRDSSNGCEPNCAEWIAAQGVITPDTPRDLRLLLDRLGEHKLPVAFSSPGGDFDAAIDIARLIHMNALDTAVMSTSFDLCSPADAACRSGGYFNIYKGRAITAGSKCNGSCLFAAVGGNKLYGKSAQVVLHHPSLYQSRSGKRGADVQLMLHFADMRIDKELLARMNTLKAGKRLELGPKEKRNWLHMQDDAEPSLGFARYRRPVETCYVNTRPSACLPPRPGG